MGLHLHFPWALQMSGTLSRVWCPVSLVQVVGSVPSHRGRKASTAAGLGYHLDSLTGYVVSTPCPLVLPEIS